MKKLLVLLCLGLSTQVHAAAKRARPLIDPAATECLFEALAQSSTAGMEQEVFTALQSGANVNARDVNDFTPLHHAALLAEQDGRVLMRLLKAGASVSVQMGSGATPLHLAAINGDVHASILLVRYGADVNECDANQQTSLHMAARHAKFNTVAALMWLGASVNKLDRFGKTPLRYAVEYGAACNDIILFLLKHGADVLSQTPDGTSIFELCGYPELRWVRRWVEERGLLPAYFYCD